jgi:hypothetical protein
LDFDMRVDVPRPRAEWFIPHETTLTLPSGEEIRVDGIPYEGWGTTPGKTYTTGTIDDQGNMERLVSWAIPLDPA